MRYLFRFLLVCIVLAAPLSCGKKAPPRWTDPLRPPKPYDIRVLQRPDEVRLAWQYPSDALDSIRGFSIERKPMRGEFSAIGETSDLFFVDTDIIAGARYDYELYAWSRESDALSNRLTTRTLLQEPPMAPADLSAAVEGGEAVLSWEHPEPDGLFHVYRTTVSGEVSYTSVSGPIRGTTYREPLDLEAPAYYTVRAFADDTPDHIVLESMASNEAAVDPKVLVPVAPSGLNAVIKPSGVLLVWDEVPDPWVRGYRIYRALGEEGSYELLGEVRTPVHTDTPPAGQRPVRYRVSALGPGGESEPSEPVVVE